MANSSHPRNYLPYAISYLLLATPVGFRFESLEIWHMARAYAANVYAVTARFPRKEDYGLTAQMNRAVNSISLNIAEGAGKKSSKAFDYHLEIALGSTYEVVAASFLSVDREYITHEQQKNLYNEGDRLCKSINAFRNSLV